MSKVDGKVDKVDGKVDKVDGKVTTTFNENGNFRVINIEEPKKPLDDLFESTPVKKKRERKSSSKVHPRSADSTTKATYRIRSILEDGGAGEPNPAHSSSEPVLLKRSTGKTPPLSDIHDLKRDTAAPSSLSGRKRGAPPLSRPQPHLPPDTPDTAGSPAALTGPPSPTVATATRLFNPSTTRTAMIEYQSLQHRLGLERDRDLDQDRKATVSSAPHPMPRRPSVHALTATSSARSHFAVSTANPICASPKSGPSIAAIQEPPEGMSLQEYAFSQAPSPSEGTAALHQRPSNRARAFRGVGGSDSAPTSAMTTKDNRPVTRQKLPTESLDLFLPDKPGVKVDDSDTESDTEGGPIRRPTNLCMVGVGFGTCAQTPPPLSMCFSCVLLCAHVCIHCDALASLRLQQVFPG